MCVCRYDQPLETIQNWTYHAEREPQTKHL